MQVISMTCRGKRSRSHINPKAWARTACLVSVLLSMKTAVLAGELEDCLIGGLKGVSSDVAARMVRQACESKVNAARTDRLIAKYGERANESLPVDTWNRWGSSGPQASIRNTSSLTATLIEVSLATPDGQGKCPVTPARKELYRGKLKPGATGLFRLGDVSSLMDKKGGVCIEAEMVRGRQPSALDISFGMFEPSSAREVDAINEELKERYATVEKNEYLRKFLELTSPGGYK